MDARKHRCRILLGASEPVAYRLVLLISSREMSETFVTTHLNLLPVFRDDACGCEYTV